MLRFDKFTLKAQESIEQSQQLAAQREHQQITPLHLLYALVSQPDGVVQPVLEKLREVDLNRLTPLEALNLLAELKKQI